MGQFVANDLIASMGLAIWLYPLAARGSGGDRGDV
jgi:hypothetical protein